MESTVCRFWLCSHPLKLPSGTQLHKHNGLGTLPLVAQLCLHAVGETEDGWLEQKTPNAGFPSWEAQPCI